MRNFLKSAKTTAMSFLSGGSPTAESTTDTADADDSTRHLQIAVEGSGAGRRKRERGNGGSGVARRVVRKLGEHEIRLTQTEARNPPGATRISVPTYDNDVHDSDWRPCHGTDMVGVKRPGFRPTNTLDEPTAQSAGRAKTFFGVHGTPIPAALSTHTVAGGNVHKEKTNTAFESHQAAEHSPKRQKLSASGRPSQRRAPQAVDLTDGENVDLDLFTAIPHRKHPEESVPAHLVRTSRKLKLDDDPFASRESARANSFTADPKRSKSAKRRSDNEARNGSQRSSVNGSVQSPPAEMQETSSEQLTGTRKSPMVIDGTRHGTHTNSVHGSTRPPLINLDRDLPESKLDLRKTKTKDLRGSSQDLHKANSMLAPARPLRPTNKPPVASRIARVQKPADSPHRESEKLRNNFKRDIYVPGNPIKAKDRMRAESRESRSSPDELDSGRTIPSNHSPHKGSMGMLQSSARRDGAQQQRPSTASAYAQPTGRVAAPHSEASSEESEDKRIEIKSIFSKQCVQQQKSLALVWDEKEERFFVACGESMIRLPYRDTLVSISKSDVGVSWTHNSDIAKAMLKGSSTEFSNGIIVIDFEDERGLSTCYNYLYDATRDHMKSITVVANHMERVFQQQSKTCSIAHQKLLQAGPPVADTMINRRAGERSHQIDAEEEEIKYEIGSTTTREALVEEHSAEVRSHYFDSDATRRSTRQAKPTFARPKTPTPPPRWSELHAPITWPHPVVYPSEGARRVTVFDSDIPRLDEGEYLNDNLLGFAIRYIEERMSPVYRPKVHFFNTFFYSSLMKNRRKMDYDAVKRWTKNIDIFTVPYTVVPINNDLHWYFAIICNMQFLDRKLSGAEEQEIDVTREDVGRLSQSSIIDIDDEADERVTPRPTNDSGRIFDGGKDHEVLTFEENGRVEQSIDAASSIPLKPAAGKKSKKPKQKAAAPTKKYDTNSPVIIMLDSFGHQRGAESTALKRYIQAEAKEKRAMDVDLGQIQGLNAKGLPEQPNFCDCGVFVIGYLEKFARDPDTFVRKLLQREMDPEKDFSDFSAPDMRKAIRDTLLMLAAEQDAERKALKAQKAQRKATTTQTGTLAEIGKQASPVRQQQPTQGIPDATSRSASAPGPSPAKIRPPSSVPTSQTAGHARSSSVRATLARTGNAIEDEDDLEVSPPTGLMQPGGASFAHKTASPSSPESDDEMLDIGDESTIQTSVPAYGIGAIGQLSPNPQTQNPASSTAVSLGPSSRRKTSSSTGSVEGHEAPGTDMEIADSQGQGYP